jgi:hypothetical protein
MQRPNIGIGVYVIIDKFQGTLKNFEPNKTLSWEWFDLEAFPEPLFLPTENLLKKGDLLPFFKLPE